MNRTRNKFYAVLSEAVQEGLDVFSPSISQVVLFYVRKNASIPLNHRFIDPKTLEKNLEKIFGFGAKVIEKKILEVLYLKLQAPLEVIEDFRFSEEVEKAQKLFDSTISVAETYARPR